MIRDSLWRRNAHFSCFNILFTFINWIFTSNQKKFAYFQFLIDFDFTVHANYCDTCYPVIKLFEGMSNLPENVIHVTGFGVFRGFTEKNPSWQAVNQLPDYIIHNGQPIAIVKHEIPVTYVAVDQKVQEIWASKPKVST